MRPKTKMTMYIKQGSSHSLLLNAGFAHFFEQKIQRLFKARTFKDTFPIFQGLHSVRKKSLESMSFLVLPQHEQFYPEVLSLFAGLDKVSTKIQGLSSTYFNFQRLSRTFKVCLNPVNVWSLHEFNSKADKTHLWSINFPFSFYLQ